MNWLQRWARDWNELLNPPKKAKPHQTRRLTAADLISFDEAAEERQPPKNIEDIRAILAMKNPHRMVRLRRDFKWMQRQMNRLDLNPDDARWIL